MSRWLIAILFLLTASLANAQAISGGTITGGTLGATSQLSVILVVGDDLGTDSLSTYGSTETYASTDVPAFDSMAADGLRFTQAYVNHVCGPTRASLSLGQFNARIGTFTAGGANMPNDSDHFLGNMLRANGVQTVITGKFGPFGGTAGTDYGLWYPQHMGFDSFRGYFALAPSTGYRAWDGYTTTQAGFDAVPGGDYTGNPPTAIVSGVGLGAEYIDDVSTDYMLAAYAARDRSRPFYGQLNLANVHLPAHNPSSAAPNSTCSPDPDGDNCIKLQQENLDAHLQQVLDAVDAHTIVLYVSDNGTAGGAYAGVSKATVRENGVRVPLMAVGRNVPNDVISDSVSPADYWTTLVDLFGMTTYGGSDTLDGYSFATLLGETCGFTGRCWINRTGIVYSAESETGDRLYRDTDHVTYGPYALIYNRTTGGAQLRNLTGYQGWGTEPSDLCTSGVCTSLVDVDRDAYDYLCTGLNAIETPLSLGGSDCIPLGTAAPTSLVATDAGTSGDVGLDWNYAPTGDVAYYEVEYQCPPDSFSAPTQLSPDPTTNSASVSGLTDDVACEFRVRAADDNDDVSPWSNTDTATPTLAGSPPELFNLASANIFDSYECDPDDVATTGIIFCDGFEDGMWIDPTVSTNCNESTGITANDGWVPHSQMCLPTSCSSNGRFWCDTYSTAGSPAFKFGHLRPGSVIDTAVGNFGAAGTPGAASSTWIGSVANPRTSASAQGLGASHAIAIAGGDPWTLASDGPQHYYFRMYYALRGVTSTVCDCNAPGSWDCDDDGVPTAGACPAFSDVCGNGLKGVEEEESLTASGGLSYGMEMGHHWACTNMEVADYSSQAFLDLSGAPGDYLYEDAIGVAKFTQNSPAGGGSPLNTRTPDFFYYVEVELDRGTDGTDGAVRMWINNCGLSGMDCGPGTSNTTPTLRAEYTGLDLIDVRFGDDGFRAFWMNYWTTGIIGERVFDNMAAADGAIRGSDNPIGFHPNMAGVTVTP